jgi:hypothetical protein
MNVQELRDLLDQCHPLSDVYVADGDVVASAAVWTPWTAFLVFVFGPCEPLVPLLMYPAAKASYGAVAAVAAAFAVATVGTMVAAVAALRYGLAAWPLSVKAGVAHAAAGLAILVCGVLMIAGF